MVRILIEVVDSEEICEFLSPHRSNKYYNNCRNTRLAKLDAPDGPYSALILAKAGLVRLGLGRRCTADLSAPTLYHAVSQGALALEIRSDDIEAKRLCETLTHWETQWRCYAERMCLRVLEGGCSVPVGIESRLDVHITDGEGAGKGGKLRLTGCVTSLDGGRHVEYILEEEVSSLGDAEGVGARLARVLMDNGAQAILDEITQDRERRAGEDEG